MLKNTFDIITVGHFTIDQIFTPKIAHPKPVLGGSPTYVSIAARKMGANVSVISKVGVDFPNEYVRQLTSQGVDLSGLQIVKDAFTTRFVLMYKNESRKLRLEEKAPTIHAKDIGSINAKAVHVAPVADEITEKAVKKLRTKTKILSLDPQGFTRICDGEGNVLPKKWASKPILENVDIFKASLKEVRLVSGIGNLESAMKKICSYGIKIVIVTLGLKGAKLLLEDRFYNVPACKPRVVKDLTGAGDTFMGAFLAEYVKGKDPVWCAYVGSAAASFVVEDFGPESFGEKEEVYERASKLYKRS
ncbi:MAG: PfkB family carbohydrate kinase [Candidatus Bathyarchaeia archaeon]